jgi:hypothetical protein
MKPGVLLLLPALLWPASSWGQGEPVLPPALPWSGASEAWIAEDDDPWITPA